MPIDSTLLANMPTSLESTIEGASLYQIQYQSLIDARYILNRDDHFLIRAYENKHSFDLGTQLKDRYEKLRDSLFVSQCLFDKEIFEKMKKILALFKKAREEYYNLNIIGFNLMGQVTDEQKFQLERIITVYANDADKMVVELNKIIPNIGNILKPWQEAVFTFNDFIETSGIMTDVDKYIMVQSLDK